MLGTFIYYLHFSCRQLLRVTINRLKGWRESHDALWMMQRGGYSPSALLSHCNWRSLWLVSLTTEEPASRALEFKCPWGNEEEDGERKGGVGCESRITKVLTNSYTVQHLALKFTGCVRKSFVWFPVLNCASPKGKQAKFSVFLL